MVKIRIRYKKDDVKILDSNEYSTNCGEDSELLACPSRRINDDIDLEADALKREKERINQLNKQVKKKELEKKIRDTQKKLKATES